MKNFSLLKQEFLKKWIKSLQICSSSSKNMGILERKNAIKFSANLAMAFARKGRTSWSQAVIAKASQNNDNKNKSSSNNNNNDMGLIKKASKETLFRSKKIMKRSQNAHRAFMRKCKNKYSSQNKVLPNSMAKRLVQKRTQVLKSLVPGGDQCLDEVSLMRETLDYIISLRAQIDVMRCLAGATSSTTEPVNGKSYERREKRLGIVKAMYRDMKSHQKLLERRKNRINAASREEVDAHISF